MSPLKVLENFHFKLLFSSQNSATANATLSNSPLFEAMPISELCNFNPHKFPTLKKS
jgi:hypothetical protein